MNPLWTLAPGSMLLGAAMLWVFRRTTDAQAVRSAINRIQAHLLEFWLFVDEPALIWKSWRGLIAAIGRLYHALLVPLVVISIPMVPVFFFLDAIYGSAALPVGKPALVTLAMDQLPNDLSALPRLQASAGISIESPPVRTWGLRQVSWRIRPLRAESEELRCFDGAKMVTKSVSAGDGFRHHSPRRTRSLLELVRYPTEAPLPDGPIEWIGISYPSGGYWWLWFLLFSTLGASAAAIRSRS